MPHTKETSQDTLTIVAAPIPRCRNGSLLTPYCWFYSHTCSFASLLFLIYLFSRIIDGETRIGIFATRDIKKGEHLTYDYQYEHLHHSYCILLNILLSILVVFCSKQASFRISFWKMIFACQVIAGRHISLQFFFSSTQFPHLTNLAGLFNLVQIKIAIVEL